MGVTLGAIRAFGRRTTAGPGPALTRRNRLPKLFTNGLIAPEKWRSRTRKPGRKQEEYAMTGIIRAGSRRDVLKLTALAGVGTLIGGGPGQVGQALAAPKSLTMMQESSFAPPPHALFTE